VSRPAQAGSPIWFIEAAGRVWGPYPEARLASFVAEGRVARETLVGTRPEGPFAPAVQQARLRGLFGETGPDREVEAEVAALAPRPAARPQPRAEPVRAAAPEPREERVAEPGPGAEAARPLLVWTSLASVKGDRFEAALGGFGPFVRVQPGLWLVRARMGPAALRNALTRRMQAGDSLIVIHAPLDQTAWFNLDGETDRTLRQLWMG
jgi:hypothetical protein